MAGEKFEPLLYHPLPYHKCQKNVFQVIKVQQLWKIISMNVQLK